MQNRETTLWLERRNDGRQGSASATRRRVTGLLGTAILALPMWLAPAQAGAAALGSSAINANIALPMGAWTTLNAIVVPAPHVTTYCTAVGSADINSPPGGAGTYLFTLTVDAPAPPMNLGQERTVQYVVGGPVIKEVSSTQGFVLAPNVNHVIRWLGRPAPGNPATTALDRSMTVVCDQDTLGIYNSNPEPPQD